MPFPIVFGAKILLALWKGASVWSSVSFHVFSARKIRQSCLLHQPSHLLQITSARHGFFAYFAHLLIRQTIANSGMFLSLLLD